MTAIQVTPARLREVSGQLNSGQGEINSILAKLAGNVNSLGGDWAGVAQAKFHGLWDEWQRSATGLQNALEGISRLTAQAAENYESTEQAIASSFGA
jgi:WXG100 family type VII secretion target